MIRFTEWSRDVRTAVILMPFMLLLIGHGGSDVTPNSAEDAVVDEMTGSSTDTWESTAPPSSGDRSPTVEPLSNVRANDTGFSKIRHRHRDEEMLSSWLDATDCTLEAIMHEMSVGNGSLPILPSPCHSQYLTISRKIPSPSVRVRRDWTNSYSFSLSTLDRNGTILNATLQFPVSVTLTGNWSSIRVAVEVQLIGDRAAIFRGFSSQRFRRKRLPTQLCFRVSAASVVQSLVHTGSGSLVTNIRVTYGNVTQSQGGAAAEERNGNPLMTVDALRQRPCSANLWNSFSERVP